MHWQLGIKRFFVCNPQLTDTTRHGVGLYPARRANAKNLAHKRCEGNEVQYAHSCVGSRFRRRAIARLFLQQAWAHGGGLSQGAEPCHETQRCQQGGRAYQNSSFFNCTFDGSAVRELEARLGAAGLVGLLQLVYEVSFGLGDGVRTAGQLRALGDVLVESSRHHWRDPVGATDLLRIVLFAHSESAVERGNGNHRLPREYRALRGA